MPSAPGSDTPELSSDTTPGHPIPTDKSLAVAAALGDRHAFETLVHRHGPALHRYSRTMLADEGDILEVVQDTFVAAWKQLGTFRGEASVRTWLFSILSHKIVDSYRVKRAQPIDNDLLEPLPANTPDPFAFASNSEFMAALELALAELAPRQRASWVLREVEDMTFPEIGRVLGLSPDAVRGQHHRARTLLSQRMARWR